MKLKIISLLVLTFTLNFAAYGKSKARAFSFFEDGGKHSQGECDPEKKAPRKLKRKKDFSKYGGYMGSELIETAEVSTKGTESWKHYFSSSSACNATLKHQPMAEIAQ